MQSGFILSAACFSNRAILQVIRRRDFLLSWVCAQSSFQSCKGRSQEQKLKLSYASLWGKDWLSCSSPSKTLFLHLVFGKGGGLLENLITVNARDMYKAGFQQHSLVPGGRGYKLSPAATALWERFWYFFQLHFWKAKMPGLHQAAGKVSSSLDPASLHRGKEMHVPTRH